MCGIWTYIKLLQNKNKIDFSKLYEDFMKLQTRGPDTSSFNIYNNNICIGFHRLAIMDLNFHANQPYILEDLGTNNVISSVSQNKALGRTIICICNGEIYNFKELDQKHNLNILNNADCMTIPKLYIKYTDFLKNESTDISKFSKLFETEIKGEFAFILLEFHNLPQKNFKIDSKETLSPFDSLELKKIVVGRDTIGIRPLFYHPVNVNSSDLIFSSEIKALTNYNNTIEEFPPGKIMDINITNMQITVILNYDYNLIYDVVEKYVYKSNLQKELSEKDSFDNSYSNELANVNSLQKDLKNSVDLFHEFSSYKKPSDFSQQELNEIPSLRKISKTYDIEYYLENIRTAVINSIKRRLCADRPIAFLLSGGVDSSLVAAIASKLLNKSINTYCCGFEGGIDLEYAKKVADHIKSNHTEVYFTPEEGLQSINDVIYTTETWDITTVRASVGQYLISKYIATQTEAKVVMVGEGPDEVCSSYLFNYYAPNGKELHEVAKEYVKKIHIFDGRRADRCISRWGLETRIPFLDIEFIKAYWEIPAEWRHPKFLDIEKWWLRKAFENTGILPSEVLWRKKEAFSDGISKKTKSWFEIINDYINNIEETFKNIANKTFNEWDILFTCLPSMKENDKLEMNNTKDYFKLLMFML